MKTLADFANDLSLVNFQPLLLSVCAIAYDINRANEATDPAERARLRSLAHLEADALFARYGVENWHAFELAFTVDAKTGFDPEAGFDLAPFLSIA